VWQFEDLSSDFEYRILTARDHFVAAGGIIDQGLLLWGYRAPFALALLGFAAGD